MWQLASLAAFPFLFWPCQRGSNGTWQGWWSLLMQGIRQPGRRSSWSIKRVTPSVEAVRLGEEGRRRWAFSRFMKSNLPGCEVMKHLLLDLLLQMREQWTLEISTTKRAISALFHVTSMCTIVWPHWCRFFRVRRAADDVTVIIMRVYCGC